MEHVEEAGVHSGDSACAIPPQTLPSWVVEVIEAYTRSIANALDVRGLINVQYAVSGTTVYVIEANPRASRTVPFIAKAYGEPYVNWATKVMLGARLKDFQFKPRLDGYAIKVPVFSFDKFPNVDKSLGPEMKSTGEAIYFIKDLKDPFFRQVYGERSMYLSR
jgi:carbamoyl-phosphate synthase large subunit